MEPAPPTRAPDPAYIGRSRCMSDEVIRRFETIGRLVSPLVINASAQCTIRDRLRADETAPEERTIDQIALIQELEQLRVDAAQGFDELLAYLLENFHGNADGEADRVRFNEARNQNIFLFEVFRETPQNLIPLLVIKHLLYTLKLKFRYQDVKLFTEFTDRYGSAVLIV